VHPPAIASRTAFARLHRPVGTDEPLSQPVAFASSIQWKKRSAATCGSHS
jgi:hypothetical protein